MRSLRSAATQARASATSFDAQPSSRHDDGSILLLALTLSIVGCSVGMSQFGGFDLSPMIDLGWRLTNGQLPYDDFVLTFPTSFSIVATLACQIYGVKWSSLIAFNSFLAIVSTYVM